MKRGFWIVFLILWGRSLGAQQCAFDASLQTARPLGPLLKPIVEEYEVPGMVAAVLSSEKILAIGSSGVRLRGSSSKIAVTDAVHIGSDTKAMTATLLALLVESHLLEWDTKVIALFPELKGKIDAGYATLTLEELLTHRGGVPANAPYKKFQDLAHNDLVKGRQKAMEHVLATAPDGDRGDFLYSNMSYVIAGHMAEKVTGSSWEQLMQEKIFKPLGMKSAGFGPPSLVVGHDEDGEPVLSADNPALLGPAGTVHASVQDLAKYVAIHLQGAEGKSCFLSLKSFETLHQPVTTSPPPYAMGWFVEAVDWAPGKVLTHTGSNTFWYTTIWIIPARDLAIIVACNEGSDKAYDACQSAGRLLFEDQTDL